jgi:hypothetical protein
MAARPSNYLQRRSAAPFVSGAFASICDAGGTTVARSGLLVFCSSRVLHDADSLNGDERTAGDHLVEDRQQSVDMRLIIYDLDQHGQVAREFDEARGVYHTVRAESGDAVNYRRAGEAFTAEPVQQDAMERRMMKLVRLSKENPHQALVPIQYSHCDLLCHLPAKQLPGAQHSEPAGDERAHQRGRRVQSSEAG